MKKLFLALVLLCVMAGPAVPETLYSEGGVLYTNSYTLLSAVTTTGTVGTAKFFTKAGQYVPVSKHMFTAVWSGTTPSNIVFTIDCSENGTNYGTCASVTMTASPTIGHIDKPGVKYTRSTYVSRSNGTVDTALTVTMTSGGQ